ncbi:hypothetical protein ACFFRR_006164 [Megaselia abdita]
MVTKLLLVELLVLVGFTFSKLYEGLSASQISSCLGWLYQGFLGQECHDQQYQMLLISQLLQGSVRRNSLVESIADFLSYLCSYFSRYLGFFWWMIKRFNVCVGNLILSDQGASALLSRYFWIPL